MTDLEQLIRVPIYKPENAYPIQYVVSFADRNGGAIIDCFIDFDSVSGDTWWPYLHWRSSSRGYSKTLASSDATCGDAIYDAVFVALKQYVLDNWWHIVTKEPLIEYGNVQSALRRFGGRV